MNGDHGSRADVKSTAFNRRGPVRTRTLKWVMRTWTSWGLALLGVADRKTTCLCGGFEGRRGRTVRSMAMEKCRCRKECMSWFVDVRLTRWGESIHKCHHSEWRILDTGRVGSGFPRKITTSPIPAPWKLHRS
jgi:hypothetical protein